MKSWTHAILALLIIGIGLIALLVFGLDAYMRSTAPTFHPDAQQVPSVSAFDPSSAWSEPVARARQIMRNGIAEQNLPGVSVAVAVGQDVVWAEGFGWADLETRAGVTPNLRFRTGTASKVLTSAAVGLLMEEGRMNPDDVIQMYVPDFPDKEWPVTLRQVMAHTAGLRTDGGDEGPYREHCERVSEALRIFADQSLLFEPDTRFRFSNYGWMLVSAAVERVSGEPFLRVMREKVFAPLRMEDTVPDSSTERIPDTVTPYFPRYSADPRLGLHPMREIDLSCYSGSSVFLSTPTDLVRFGAAINAGTLLRPETVRQLQTSQRLVSGEETGYGLGWDLETVTLGGQPTRTAGHRGHVLGGETMALLTFPERGLVVAVMSNISYADAFGLAVQVAEAFAGSMSAPSAR